MENEVDLGFDEAAAGDQAYIEAVVEVLKIATPGPKDKLPVLPEDKPLAETTLGELGLTAAGRSLVAIHLEEKWPSLRITGALVGYLTEYLKIKSLVMRLSQEAQPVIEAEVISPQPVATPDASGGFFRSVGRLLGRPFPSCPVCAEFLRKPQISASQQCIASYCALRNKEPLPQQVSAPHNSGMIRHIFCGSFFLKKFSLGGLALIAVFTLASAGAAKPLDKLHDIEQRLLHQKEQQAALDQKARETGDNLGDLRKQLIAATEALQSKEEENESLEDKLDALNTDIAAKKSALKGERVELNDLIAALLTLSRQPPQATFLQTRLTTDYIHRTILLKAAVPRLSQQAELIAQDLGALKDLQRQLAEQKRLVTAAGDNLRSQQYGLDQLIKARQGLLQRTELQREAIAKQLVSLSDEAKDLRELLAKVTPKAMPKARHIDPSIQQAALRPPVAGSLLRGFGAIDNDGVTSEGFTFAALNGSPVIAPRSGKVVFAGVFRGYGKILILQHAGGYHSFLAGFGRIDAEMGQEVEAGEPLGVLPVKTGTRPELYFEWRRNNEPVNPGGFILSKSP